MRRILLLTAILTCAVGRPAAQDVELLAHEVYFPYEGFSPYNGGLSRPFSAAINSVQEWQALWSEVEPRLARDEMQRVPYPLPHLDFDRYTMLVVAAGSRPSGGFSVGFESVREYSSHIEVTAYEVRPNGAKCIATAIVTYPIAFALIRRTTKAVQFDTARADSSCGE